MCNLRIKAVCFPRFLGLNSFEHTTSDRDSQDHSVNMAASCLSTHAHKPHNFMLHYLGCLEFCQREHYFSSLPQDIQDEIEAELRRIYYLRDTLGRDHTTSGLVRNVETSLNKWRKSPLYTSTTGLTGIQAWRSGKGRKNGFVQREVSAPPSELGKYDPDRDAKAYVVKYRSGRPVLDLHDKRFTGCFPDHKTSVSHLLDAMDDYSISCNEKSDINWIHLPVNNMKVGSSKSYFLSAQNHS